VSREASAFASKSLLQDTSMPSRRGFLRGAAAAGAGLWLPGATMPARARPLQPRDPWAGVEAILGRIVPPHFPDRDFDIASFGARADSGEPATDALRAAIAACHSAGGGRIVVPPGRFLTGAIRLESDVELHVSEGATLAFETDPRAYLPTVLTRFEGVEAMSYSPLIYALDAENVAVTGAGTLDGQADEAHWWPWKGGRWGNGGPDQAAGRARLFEMAERGTPVAERVLGEGSYLRSSFVQPYRCRNVLVEGVRIVGSPMWEVHPVLCTNVTVRGVRIESHGPNNDGCNPESSRDVLIESCSFDTGDDCIALKSGRNADGRRVGVPVENVVVRNCVMKDGHGGVVIGSEVSGGARTVFAERCRMSSPNLDRALRIKTNSVRGGVVEHVYMRDVTVGEVAEAVLTVNFFYEEGDAGGYPPIVRDVELRGVTSRKSRHAVLLRGFAHDPIRDVRIVDCSFDGVEGEDVVEGVVDLTWRNTRVNGRLRDETISR
jgi:polygalacturonase